jgi:HJR/Mrr/RecB family endonuclease
MSDVETKAKTKTYDLENKGEATRITYDVNMQQVTVEVGQTVRGIELTDAVVKEFRDRNDPLVATESGTQRPPAEPNRSPDPGLRDRQVEQEQRAVRAKELLAEADTTQFNEFAEKARTFLGDKWPGGTPKKRVITDLLEDAVRGV